MIELYLNGRKADLEQEADIAITYQSLDTSSPQAIKNSFSKTVSLKGTKTNNAIFGEVYRLDRNVLESTNPTTVIEFDPRKRVDFQMLSDGDMVDEGYAQLDEIVKNGPVNTYNITLYGSLGDFFYNLSIDQEGKELRLCDLKYGFENEDGYILTWDKDYIKSSWNKLSQEYSSSDIQQNITAVPTYSGNYEQDFDNSKVMVNYSGLSEAATNFIGSAITSGSTTATTKYNFSLVEASRDLDEWEVRDLRSVFQRPCIKLSKVMEAISDPVNNGGFNVEWDSTILDSPYYRDTFVLQSRLDLEDSDNSNLTTLDFGNTDISGETQSQLIGLSDTGNAYYNRQWSKKVNLLYKEMFLLGSGGAVDIPISEAMLNLGRYNAIINIDYSGVTENRYYTHFNTVCANVYPTMVLPISKSDPNIVKGDIMAGVLFKFDYMVNGVSKAVKHYFIYSDYDKIMDSATHTTADFKAKLETYAGGSVTMLNLANTRNEDRVNRTIWEYREDLVSILSGSSANDNLRVKMTVENMNLLGLNSPSNCPVVIAFNDNILFDAYYGRPLNGRDGIVVNITNSEYIDAGIDIDESVAGQSVRCTKDMIINSEKSPFEFLTGFAKLFNLRFLYDKGHRTVHIIPLSTYYKDEIVDLSTYIDRSEDITITPAIAETQFYKYCLPTPETYAQGLYYKKVKKEFGEYTKDTGYNFEREIEDLFSENMFTNLIPFRLSSIFMGDVKKNNTLMPQIAIAPTFTLKLWNSITGEAVTQDKTGLAANINLGVTKTYDNYPKLCCFDDDNSTVEEATDAIVFFTGFENVVGRHYILSDNLKYMLDLNGGQFCHLYTESTGISSPYQSDINRVSLLDYIPLFGKYLIDNDGMYSYSLDMTTPAMSFCNDIQRYKADRGIYDVYFSRMVDDLYSKDGKKVSVRTFLTKQPQEAMRVFYFFDGSYWILTKIDNYNPESKRPVQCEFVKVLSLSNYLTPPSSEEYDIPTTTTTAAPPEPSTTTTTTTTTPAP